MMDVHGQTRKPAAGAHGPDSVKDGERFLSLLKFYLACIEEEDLQSLPQDWLNIIVPSSRHGMTLNRCFPQKLRRYVSRSEMSPSVNFSYEV